MFPDNGETKELNIEALDKTIQAVPPSSGYGFGGPGAGILVFNIAAAADDIPAWGQNWRLRDKKLREFWPTEPVMAGAVYSMMARDAALDISFDGPPRTVKAVQDMWDGVDYGGGPTQLISKLKIDLITQDNGAYLEVIRDGPGDEAALMGRKPPPPVVSLSHLDAGQCWRTGNPYKPVIYQDPDDGGYHELAWYQVVVFSEMPSPIKRMRGMQYSALTRALRAAQIFRDIAIYKREKVGGRNPTSIHLVSGVAQSRITDSMKLGQETADNQGFVRYMLPVILASLDPNAAPAHVEIALKSLPDGFDEEAAFRLYISQLAMDFGADYQDFAPLPGGNLGTSQQSQMLDRKSSGKGKALFVKIMTRVLNYGGILPNNVTAEYQEKDVIAERDEWTVKQLVANTYKTLLDSGTITVPVARQMAQDDGILKPEYLELMAEEDVTEDVTVEADVPYQEPDIVVPIPVEPPAVVSPAPAVKSLNAMAAEALSIARKALKRLR